MIELKNKTHHVALIRTDKGFVLVDADRETVITGVTTQAECYDLIAALKSEYDFTVVSD